MNTTSANADTTSTTQTQSKQTESQDGNTKSTTVTKTVKKSNAGTSVDTTKDSTYNQAYNATKKLYQTRYHFYKQLNNVGKVASAKGDYGKSFKLTRIAKTNKDTYVKTARGWISSNAFNQYVKEQGSMNEKMKVTNASTAVYSAPAATKNAQKLGTASSLGLTDQWLNVNYRKYTNTKEGYFRVTKDGQNYYINGRDMEFNLSGLNSHNAKIEKAIKVGEALVGKSPYSWGGGRTAASIAARRFDCSSFIHYIYAKAGVNLGSVTATTYTLAKEGRAVNYKNMKRGDIFFFNDKKEGAFCHVGIYLGRGLFLNDSPSTDTHGVGISSLSDPHWARRFNHVVRRVV
ncbi:NlpC/P60 family protein [Nicoliella spurrieriana]|uniref:NlpC/P60 family protein n=1 Tax=Nicoliella spurrieriana TaxID=2925830 RepID=A0A976RT60_9LACO|nr:C40 family peptidase [Nicoliella spurrieriana]UQS87338.1 NlpC/P60 family protein [Nicoliella spurrieriana]